MEKKYIVICSVLIVRKEPSLDSAKDGFYEYGEILNLLEDNINIGGVIWGKIKTPNEEIRYVTFEINGKRKLRPKKVLILKNTKNFLNQKENKSLASLDNGCDSILKNEDYQNFIYNNFKYNQNLNQNKFDSIPKSICSVYSNPDTNLLLDNISPMKCYNFESNIIYSSNVEMGLETEIESDIIKNFPEIFCNNHVKIISGNEFIRLKKLDNNEYLAHKHEIKKEPNKIEHIKVMPKHDKNSTDNLRRKIKNLLINFLRKKLNNEINNELKKLCPYELNKLENSCNKNIKILKNRKEKGEENIKYYNDLLKRQIKEIFSSDIIKDVQYNKEHNKILIELIFEMHEKMGYFGEIVSILNMELIDFIEYSKNNWESNINNNLMLSLKEEIKKISKNKNDFIKSFKFLENNK